MLLDGNYVGSELSLFAKARNWKRYILRELRPFIRGDVLEVGAGEGGTRRFLLSARWTSWTCLEPDRRLAGLLAKEVGLDPRTQVVESRLSGLDENRKYDTVLYIDVLEHIEDDRSELRLAAMHLRPGGALVVLAPAHGWLFSKFDEAVGHYRRYSRSSLRAVGPSELNLIRLNYLDSVGLFASLANRLFLRQSIPTARQIAFWDSAMVPCSRVLDAVLLKALGKTVVAVWQRRHGLANA